MIQRVLCALSLMLYASAACAQSADELLKKAAKLEKEHRYGQAFGALNTIVREHG